jgi:hypothetical protein
VPAARHQAGEQAGLGGILVEVKRLRVELAGERLDLRFVDAVGLACEALPHVKVIEIKQILAAYFTRQRHDPSTGQWSFDE